MPYNRKAIAPWSTERKQGIESATVDSNIETPQYLQPVVNTGTIDLNGNWIGVATSDKLFTIDTTHEAIPNGAVVLSPQKQPDFIDMTGFKDIFVGIFVTRTGDYAIEAVMGPDTNPFANLTPIDAATTILTNEDVSSTLESAFKDTAQTLTTNVWNIFTIHRLENQKMMQFKITNNSGANSDITFAYLRMI